MSHAPLISTAEAARRLGVSERTLRRLYLAGKVPSIKVTDTAVRFDPDELDRYIDSRGRGPSTPPSAA